MIFKALSGLLGALIFFLKGGVNMSLSAENTRRIKLHNVWSTDPTLDLVMAGNSPIPAVTPKSSTVDISTADGVIDTSRSSGRLRFNPIVISYTFTHSISRYDEHGSRLTIPEMNRLVKEHTSTVEDWLFDPEEYDYNPGGSVLRLTPAHFNIVEKFYDTGLCDPDNATGYWLPNPRCTNFSVSKALSPDVWVVQYAVEITTDPYMYEYTANPHTYAMFSGPTTAGASAENVEARIYTFPRGGLITETSPRDRYLWTNDNIQWILSTSAEQRGAGYWATWNFKPSVMPIYSGKIGLYMNFYVNYTYNDVLYKYHVDTLQVNGGYCDFISSSKITTPQEMAITNQNGCELYAVLVQEGDSPGSLADLITETNGHIPLPFTWGVCKRFVTYSPDTKFMVIGHGPSNSFAKVVGAGPSTVSYSFGDEFTLDNDGYNELKFSKNGYGFYSLESPDNARRKI